jgi:hypothetical protein
MALDHIMTQELEKIIDKTIEQIPKMAMWLSSKNIDWHMLEITNESDFMKGAIVSQIVNQFAAFLVLGYKRELTAADASDIQKIVLTRADDIKNGIKAIGI